MRDRPSGHRIRVDVGVDPMAVDARPEVEAPFCVALFGDFSARAHRERPAAGTLASREPILVDRDNLDEVVARLRPELRVPLRGARDLAVGAEFRSLEDFHPDRLYERLPVFEGARELRRRLSEAPRDQPRRASPAVAPPAPPAPVDGNLLDQIVAQSPVPPPGAARELSPLEGGDLQDYLNRIVAPHLVPGADPSRAALLAELDAVAAGGLRSLLHHPDFQALEALWRGVHLLTRGVESDTDVRLYLFDATQAELAADQHETADASSSHLYRLLAEPPAAAPESGWGALGGLYAFTPDAGDLELLGRLGAVASLVEAPWISAADPRLAGCDSIHSTPDPADWVAEPSAGWQTVRRLLAARWIGLAMPRFLLRPPYGEQGRRCEALPFEELSDRPTYDEYLWGNPALACLLLLLQAIAAAGRPVYPGMSLEVGGLPFAAQSSAEALLGERAAERILDRGLMPLVAIRDTDRLRLLRLQSIADPATALAGRWGPAPEG
jgi:type VI secretion system protein ImpC